MLTFKDLLVAYLDSQAASCLAMAVPKPQVQGHNKISAPRHTKSNNMRKARESEGLMPGERAVLWEESEEEPEEEQRLLDLIGTWVIGPDRNMVRLRDYCFPPPPDSMPQTGLLGPNRNMEGLGRSRLCPYHLGMRDTGCQYDSRCAFAHRLWELDVPNESPQESRWSTVWIDGQVDICFWHDRFRSEESKKRFQKAFLSERAACERIPNWAWGLAAHTNIIPHDLVPKDVPLDHDWPRLQEAWEEGLRGECTMTDVRKVLMSPNSRHSASASAGLVRGST